MPTSTILTAPLPGESVSFPPELFKASFDHLDPTKAQGGFVKKTLNDGQGKDIEYWVFEKGIIKSANDDRDYRLIRLTNGMEALLVSDAKTDKAAASLSVRVGSMSDPDELQGLAHFLEHELFMGTEKYPIENDYSDFLSRNNGSSNAFTSLTETQYFFDVSPTPTSFHGALSRFSQFFIAPLFSPSCVEREVKAVDSENQKNLQDDMWRIEQVKQSESARGDGRKFWHFGTGSRETLWWEPKRRNPELEDGGIRDELLKFHDRYYSANVMKLALLGKDSLDTLTEWAVTLFSDAKNKNVAPPRFPEDAFTPNELQKRTVIQTLRERRNMEILFPFPPQDDLFASKPSNFISHFIGHEGPGSILSHLKKKGWADSLYAGSSNESFDFDFFTINIALTQAGLENYEAVASSVFKYISLLRVSPPPEWSFSEQRSLNRISFRFLQKGPPQRYVSYLSGKMHEPYTRETILWGPSMMEVWNDKAVRDGVELLKVGKARVTICAKEVERVAEKGALGEEKKEEWYGTQYWVQELPEGLRKLDALDPKDIDYEDLALPGPNPYVPENLDVIGKTEAENPTRRPLYISENPTTSVWHKKDDRWWIPKATANFLLANPLFCSDIRRNVTTQLFTILFEDELNEQSYDASLADLQWSVGLIVSGVPSLSLHISGYNDKLPVLLETVLKALKGYKVDRSRFEEMKDQYRQSLKNRIEMSKPVNMAYGAVDYIVSEKDSLPEQELPFLEAVTPEDVEKHIQEVIQDLKVTAFVSGNVVKQDGLSIATLPERLLSPKPLPSSSVQKSRGRLLPPSSNHIYTKIVPDSSNPNSAIRYSVHLGSNADQHLRCVSSLFAQVADEPAFNQLRTVEQLGYLVHSHLSVADDQRFYTIGIQSERDPVHLENRVESFLEETLRKKIEGMTEEEFGEIRDSVVARKREDYKNMGEENRAYWSTIASGLIYDFDAPRQDADIIAKITKQEVLDFFLGKILASSRSKISAHVRSQRLTSDELGRVETLIRDDANLGLVSGKDEDLKKWIAKRPTADEAKEEVWQFVQQKDGEGRKKLDELIEEIRPRARENAGKEKGAKVITDLDEFAKGLKYAERLEPVREYKDY